MLCYNGPFYPLYLLWATGRMGLPWTLLVLWAAPFFAAVPAVSRRFPLAGRLLLTSVGTINVVFCTWLLGEASGTELFLIPCVALASLLFRPGERVAMGVAAALPFAAYFLLSGHYGTAWVDYTPAQLHAVFRLNAGSVGTLMFFIGIVVAREGK